MGEVPKTAVCFLLRAKLDWKTRSPAKKKDDDNKVVQGCCNEMSGKPKTFLESVTSTDLPIASTELGVKQNLHYLGENLPRKHVD